jgi:hypothetical protein
MRKGLLKAAIVVGLAILVWRLLPDIALLLHGGFALAIAALKLLLVLLALGALWLVGALLWDAAKYLYRRLVVPRRRARRISRIRNYRNWQEAASRSKPGRH